MRRPGVLDADQGGTGVALVPLQKGNPCQGTFRRVFTIKLDQVAAIIVAAHGCEAEEKARTRRKVDVQPGRWAGPATPAADQLLELIGGLTPSELNELLALAWMGRGDFEPEDFPEALRQASNIICTHPAAYVAQLPGLADYLRSALTALGYRVSTLRTLD